MHWTFRALTIALLTGGAALAAGVDFQAGDNGRMAFAVDGAMMAEGFSVRIVKPEWTGTFDDVTRTEVLKLEPGQSRFDNTVADVATYQVTAEKKDSSVAVTYDLEFIKETPIEHASVVVYIPISFAQQGGTLSTSSQSDVPFPARCEKKFIYSGLTELLSWTNGLGQGITLRLPSPTYVQIQDNRVFEWSVFELNIRLPGDGKVGKSSFTLTVEPGAAKTEKPQPFVDRYGQCTKKEWPGKVTADEQLAADIEDEARWLERFGGRPDQWDEFGGLEGSKERFGLKATGFFHVAKVNDRPVLVDPTGNLFFSIGSMFISCDEITRVGGREQLFEWLPEPAMRNVHGPGTVSFYDINLSRKYGENAGAKWAENSRQRWWAWGFNTTGAFSGRLEGVPAAPMDMNLLYGDRVPRIAGVGPDVFDPHFVERFEANCKEVTPSYKDDPLLIGYFLTNEEPIERLAIVGPQLDATVAAKGRLVEFLRERYSDVAAFNKSWKMEAASFDDLRELKFSADTAEARADMDAFLELYCRTYGQLVREILLKHDPNHLILGHRWLPHTAANETVIRGLGPFLDVLSVNYYTSATPDPEYLRHIHQLSGGRPVLLSEWSYGCNDRGHSGGVRDVADQNERGMYYRNYVEQSAALPFVVGVQWFEYTDQAITGRVWGDPATAERHQTGLVDVTDRPYRPLLEQAAVTNHRIYDVMLGEVKPYALPESIGRARKPGERHTVRFPQLKTPVQIDGQLHDWPMVAPVISLGRPHLACGSAAVAKDLSGEFWFQWDAQNLYVLARVIDPTPMTSQQTGTQIWNGDAVEIFLSVKAADASGPMQPGDYQIGLCTGSPKHNVSPNTWNWTTDAPLAGAELAVTATTGNIKGYVLEARIPADAFEGFSPKTGLTIDFDIGLDNGDEDRDGIRTVQLMWHGTEANSYNRSDWGRAEFVE